MRTTMRCLLYRLFIILAFCFVAPTYSQDKDQIKVATSITAGDGIEDRISSYIHRELRSIPDIAIVSDESDYVLHITAMEAKNQGGRPIGVVFAYTTTEPFKNSVVVGAVSAATKNDDMPNLEGMVDQWTSGLSRYYGTNVMVTPEDKLRETCAEIVASFDSRYLEIERQHRRKVRGWLEKMENSNDQSE